MTIREAAERATPEQIEIVRAIVAGYESADAKDDDVREFVAKRLDAVNALLADRDRLQRERDEQQARGDRLDEEMTKMDAAHAETARERNASLALVTKLREALRDAADGLVPAMGDPTVREVQRRARACLAAEEPRT
jgi:chromosome segregation ATPase